MKEIVLSFTLGLSLLSLLLIILTSCQNVSINSNHTNSNVALNANKSFDFQKWRIESSTKGGINGIWDVYSLDSDGKVKYEEVLKKKKSETTTSTSVVNEITPLIKNLNLPNITTVPKTEQNGADLMFHTFSILTDEKPYIIEDYSSGFAPVPLLYQFNSEQKLSYEKIKSIVNPLFTKNLKEKSK